MLGPVFSLTIYAAVARAPALVTHLEFCPDTVTIVANLAQHLHVDARGFGLTTGETSLRRRHVPSRKLLIDAIGEQRHFVFWLRFRIGPRLGHRVPRSGRVVNQRPRLFLVLFTVRRGEKSKTSSKSENALIQLPLDTRPETKHGPQYLVFYRHEEEHRRGHA